jgi:hypothetical protein
VGVWALRWNNPRLHPPERRKIWLACEDHRRELESFLATRGLLREVVAVEDVVEHAAEDLPEGSS